MHLQTSCSALLAGLAVAAAQFSFPVKSTALKPGERCQIKWNAKGLQGPLSINLVPTDALGSSIVAQRIAVNIENTGVLAWAPDLSIAAFPSFSMVIVDARAAVVVSDAFAIGSLVQQPALVTARIPQLATLTAKDGRGQVVTRTVTADVKDKVVPSPTGPVKLHREGTKVVNSLAGAEATEQAASDGLKPLPAFAGGDGQSNGGALQPLPNVRGDGSPQEANTAREQKQRNPGVQTPAASTQKTAANTGEAAKATPSTSSSAAAPTPPPAEQSAVPEQVTTSAAAVPEQALVKAALRRGIGLDADAADAGCPPDITSQDAAQAAAASRRTLSRNITESASRTFLGPRPSFVTLTDVTLSPTPISPTRKAQEAGSEIFDTAASGMRVAPKALTGLVGLAVLAAVVL